MLGQLFAGNAQPSMARLYEGEGEGEESRRVAIALR
jgi:hypothetical protein